MKKILLGLALLLMIPLSITAQSSMTDSQVADYVQRESARGTSQAQIVTHLMQSGVDISQIRRVRRAYEQQAKGKGLGNASETATTGSRLRKSNGNSKLTKAQTEQYDKQRDATTSGRIQGNTQWQDSYDENDQDFLQMQQEVSDIMPTDTATLLKQFEQKPELRTRHEYRHTAELSARTGRRGEHRCLRRFPAKHHGYGKPRR